MAQVQISAPTQPTISGTTTPPSIDIQGHDLGYKTFLDGALVSNIIINTTQVATDTIDYVATDTWSNTAASTRMIIIEAAPSIVAPDEATTTASPPP